MLVLGADDVRHALPMDAAIEAMKHAFAALSDGRAVVPMRTHLPVERYDGVSLIMSAFVDAPEGQALGLKVISLVGGNPARGLPLVHAAVLALQPDTGRPVALLEGAALTAIRTAAACGAATDLLARPDACTFAVLGAGVQARTQLEAVCTVRSIATAWIHDPIPGKAEAMAAEMAGRGPIPTDLRTALTAREALADADIVSAATTATTPAFDDADLKPGAHINAIGSYQPHVVEVPPQTVVRALVVVDDRDSALDETGDLIQPIRHGLITPRHVHADLGELVLGRKPGRTAPDQITLFKTVGVAIEDVMAARLALANAEQLGLGQRVVW